MVIQEPQITQSAVFPDCITVDSHAAGISSRSYVINIKGLHVANNCSSSVIITADVRLASPPEPWIIDNADKSALAKVEELRSGSARMVKWLSGGEERIIDTEEKAKAALAEIRNSLSTSAFFMGTDGDDCSDSNWYKGYSYARCQAKFIPNEQWAWPFIDRYVDVPMKAGHYEFKVYSFPWTQRLQRGEESDRPHVSLPDDLLPGGFKGYIRGELSFPQAKGAADIKSSGIMVIDDSIGNPPKPVSTSEPDKGTIWAAENGNASAQREVGDYQGMKKDYASAAKWWSKAAQGGDAVAQYRLGIYYREGKGVRQDADEAKKWLRKAAGQGIDRARYELNESADQNVMQCWAATPVNLQNDAINGDAAAQFILGQFYIRPPCAGAKMTEAAMKWLRKAANQGNTGAAYSLGWLLSITSVENKGPEDQNPTQFRLNPTDYGLYKAGYDLVQMRLSRYDPAQWTGMVDYAEAAGWWQKLVAGDSYFSVTAKCGLGSLYYEGGHGIEKDASAAMKWWGISQEELNRRAQPGNAAAQLDVARLLGKSPCQDDINILNMRNAWVQKAAEGGNTDAQCELGSLKRGYFRSGMKASPEEAASWAEKAAEKEQPKAQMMLGDFYAEGFGVPKDDKKSAEWYLKAARNGEMRAACKLPDIYHSGKGVDKDDRQSFYWLRACLKYYVAFCGSDGPAVCWIYPPDAKTIAAEAEKWQARSHSEQCIGD